MSSDNIDIELELSMLRDEVKQLRYDANHTALIKNFTELMYDAENEDEILSLLLFAIPQLIAISKFRYFHLDKSALSLIEKYQLNNAGDSIEDVVEGFKVPLNFFGGVLADAVLQQETVNLDSGIEEGDELSLRYDSDQYMVIPLIARNLRNNTIVSTAHPRASFRTEEEYFQACIKSPEYPVLGAFWFDTSEIDESTIASSMSLVTSLFHTAGSVIGELRMLKQIIAINDRIEKDLRAARDVQMGLLPASLPQNGNIKASARYQTEEQVGGDYYDIFELNKGIYGIMVADASGHGTPSALIMTMTKILLKTFASTSHSPAETLEKINDAIVNNAKTNKFITSFYAILDTKENKLHYTSAGHCPQVLIHKETGNVTELESDGVFIGMFPQLNLSDHTIDFSPAEHRLVLYTDGLTESTNNELNMYGLTRLKNSAISSSYLSTDEALEKMLGLHSRFIRNHPKDDDLTLMLIDF